MAVFQPTSIIDFLTQRCRPPTTTIHPHKQPTCLTTFEIHPLTVYILSISSCQGYLCVQVYGMLCCYPNELECNACRIHTTCLCCTNLISILISLLHVFRGTLSDAISRGALCCTDTQSGPVAQDLDMCKVLTTAREIAGALQYLHSQSVLHGDLNGNNILLVGASCTRPDGRGFIAKVADFGLSRILAPGKCLL